MIIFWLVLKLEICFRVIISWRILVSFLEDFLEDYIFCMVKYLSFMFLHSYKQVCCAAAYCLTINNMQFCSSCVREQQQKTKASQNCKKWWSFSTYLPQYNVHMPKCRLQKNSVKKLATVKSRTPSAKNYEEKSSQFHLSLPTWDSGVEDSLNVHMEGLNTFFTLHGGGSFFV
jgi:hypothetical protein